MSGYSRRDALLVLAALIAASATLNLVVLPLAQVADPVRKAFGIDDVQYSLLLGGAFAIPSMLSSVGGGWLADRFSRRALLASAMLVWTLAAMWGALATDYTQVIVARVIVAGAAGIKFPLTMTWLSDAFTPEQRGKAVGILFVVLNIGPAIGSSVTGLVLQASEAGSFAALPWLGHKEPWRIALFLLASTNVLVWPCLLFLRDTRASLGTGASSDSADGSVVAGFPVGLYIALIAGAALLAIADTANLGWLPTVLRREHGMDARQAGFTFGLIATTGGLFGSLAGGFVGDRMRKRSGVSGRLNACALATIVCAPMLAAFAFGGTYTLIGCLLASGVLSIMANTIGFVALQELLPAGRRGIGTGIASAVSNLANASAPTLVALAAGLMATSPKPLGHGIALITCAAFLLASTLYALLSRRVQSVAVSTTNVAIA